MRTILLSKSDELYLGKCADEHNFAYGIVIGQWTKPDKFIVVHLAKNNEEDVDEPDSNGPQSVGEINVQSLANQWISACKMTPGSFDVLGIFVTAMSANITDGNSLNHAKKLLSDMQSLVRKVSGNTLLAFGDEKDEFTSQDFLYLTYNNVSKKADCLSFTHSSNGGTFNDMECRFVEKPFEWVAVNSNYELDDIFPIHTESTKLNIEQQFMCTVESVRRNLTASEIFLDHQNINDEHTLATFMRGNHKISRQHKDHKNDSVFASIFLPVQCQISNNQPIKVQQFNGSIRFAGVISSRIYCNLENTLGNIKSYLRTDILRSLATRIQIYCDALTDPLISNDAAVIVSEPPRRVYFNLHTDENAMRSVKFSEYIFRGEAPTVAVAQAKQILDLDIDPTCIEANAEALADEDLLEPYESQISVDGKKAGKNKQSDETTNIADPSRSIYIIGFVVAFVVLILSVLLNSFTQ